MKILNKRAGFDYEILEKHEAGLVLTGAEVKSVQTNRVELSRAFVRALGGELYLVNAQFTGVNVAEPARSRKLLMHKREIVGLIGKLAQKKLTLIPLSLYNSHARVKLEVALARSKKEYQKKESLKKQDIQRDIEREMK